MPRDTLHDRPADAGRPDVRTPHLAAKVEEQARRKAAEERAKKAAFARGEKRFTEGK